MEASTAQACKFILLTYEDGKTNHYYDSTFRLRPPFKPNANGQYSITINECLFQNNEPTLSKGDWFEIESTYYDAGIAGIAGTRQPVEPRRRSRLEMMEATWCVNAQNVGLRIQCS